MAFDTTFPDGFLWGAATASFQIEGRRRKGRSASIWDTFAAIEGNVANKDTGDPACEHYHRMPQDVVMMKALGSTPIASRWRGPVIPDGVGAVNAEGIDFYDRLVDQLLDNGIRPSSRCTTGTRRKCSTTAEAGPSVTRHRGSGSMPRPWLVDSVTASATGPRSTNPGARPSCPTRWRHHAPGHAGRTGGTLAAHHLMLGHGRPCPSSAGLCPGAGSRSPSVHGSSDPQDPTAADLDAVRRADNNCNGASFAALPRRIPELGLEDVAHPDRRLVHPRR